MVTSLIYVNNGLEGFQEGFDPSVSSGFSWVDGNMWSPMDQFEIQPFFQPICMVKHHSCFIYKYICLYSISDNVYYFILSLWYF